MALLLRCCYLVGEVLHMLVSQGLGRADDLRQIGLHDLEHHVHLAELVHVGRTEDLSGGHSPHGHRWAQMDGYVKQYRNVPAGKWGGGE